MDKGVLMGFLATLLPVMLFWWIPLPTTTVLAVPRLREAGIRDGRRCCCFFPGSSGGKKCYGSSDQGGNSSFKGLRIEYGIEKN